MASSSAGVTDSTRHDHGGQRNQRNEMHFDQQTAAHFAPFVLIDAKVRAASGRLAPANKNDRRPNRDETDQNEQPDLRVENRIVQVKTDRLSAERDAANSRDEHGGGGRAEADIGLRQRGKVDAI